MKCHLQIKFINKRELCYAQKHISHHPLPPDFWSRDRHRPNSQLPRFTVQQLSVYVWMGLFKSKAVSVFVLTIISKPVIILLKAPLHTKPVLLVLERMEKSWIIPVRFWLLSASLLKPTFIIFYSAQGIFKSYSVPCADGGCWKKGLSRPERELMYHFCWTERLGSWKIWSWFIHCGRWGREYTKVQHSTLNCSIMNIFLCRTSLSFPG